MFGAAIAANFALAACSKDPTGTAAVVGEDDYALVLFGQSGAALQGTMGPGGHLFDGRSGMPPFPEALQLTDAQKAAIETLRSDFRTAHQADLDALHAIFDRARAAHDAGATREEIRAILDEGRAIGESLRPAVEALHTAILGVLTAEQRAWLAANRPAPPPDIDGRRRQPPDRRGRGNG